MRFTDAARRVIDLGWKVWEYLERELPRRHANYPIVEPGAASAPGRGTKPPWRVLTMPAAPPVRRGSGSSPRPSPSSPPAPRGGGSWAG